jgi:hypothetical protein
MHNCIHKLSIAKILQHYTHGCNKKCYTVDEATARSNTHTTSSAKQLEGKRDPTHPVLVDDIDDDDEAAVVLAVVHQGDPPDLDEPLERLHIVSGIKHASLAHTSTNRENDRKKDFVPRGMAGARPPYHFGGGRRVGVGGEGAGSRRGECG